MQALSDDRQIERLEKRVDDGFKETKDEFRAVRTEISGIHQALHSMWLTMILGFAGLFLTMLLGLGGILLQL